MILMPFDVTISASERVIGMDKPEWWQDQGELPGVLLWALAGLQRLRQQGEFTTSAVCQDAVDEYRQEVNPARTFLIECYTKDIEGDVVTAVAYQEYRTWCETNGYRPLGASQFGKEIVRAFPAAKKAKVLNTDGYRTEGYKGIGKHSVTSDTGF